MIRRLTSDIHGITYPPAEIELQAQGTRARSLLIVLVLKVALGFYWGAVCLPLATISLDALVPQNYFQLEPARGDAWVQVARQTPMFLLDVLRDNRTSIPHWFNNPSGPCFCRFCCSTAFLLWIDWTQSICILRLSPSDASQEGWGAVVDWSSTLAAEDHISTATLSKTNSPWLGGQVCSDNVPLSEWECDC